MPAPRVFLACHRYPPDGIGGIERIVESLGQDLPALGDQVTIFTGQPRWRDPFEPALARESLGQGGRLFRLSAPARGPHQPFGPARLEELFTAALVESRPDVAHFFHLQNLSPGMLEVTARQRVPIIISLHDFYFVCPRFHLQKADGRGCAGPSAGQECAQTCFAGQGAAALQLWGLRAIYFRRLLDLADIVVCPSRYVADYFIRRQGLPPGQVRVIPNGIRPLPRPARAPFSPRQRGCLRLAFLGAIAPHKGAHRLLEAVAQAALPAVQLELNGTTHDFPDYVAGLRQRGARIAGLDLRINGPFEPDHLPRLLQSADCVVVPSQVPETFALVSREALAQGVPILVARSGGLPEAIEPGVNGLSFAPDQPAELADHLRALWEDEALLERLRRGAAQSVVMFTPEHAQEMHRLYAEVLDASRRLPDGQPALLAELATLRKLMVQIGFG